MKKIFNYYKKFDFKTVIMGASFRNVGEILELAGCDRLTISPKFLSQLSEMKQDVPAKLTVENAKKLDLEKIEMNEPNFRWMLNGTYYYYKSNLTKKFNNKNSQDEIINGGQEFHPTILKQSK